MSGLVSVFLLYLVDLNQITLGFLRYSQHSCYIFLLHADICQAGMASEGEVKMIPIETLKQQHEEICELMHVRIPREVCHPFQRKPATHSTRKLPPIPVIPATP